MKLLICLSSILLCLPCCSSNFTPEYFLQVDAKKVLHHVLHHQKGWLKVYAAESLIDLKMKHGIDSIFWAEHEQFKDVIPYRIGIWRVLEKTHLRESDWTTKIANVARDTNATDQIHAIESLARMKNNHQLLGDELKANFLKSNNTKLKAYTQWLLAVPDSKYGQPNIGNLQRLLYSENEVEKRIAAIGLRNLQYYPDSEWDELYQLALNEPSGSNAKVYLIAAALTLAPDWTSPEFKKLEKLLLSYKNSQQKVNRIVLCETLAEVGRTDHYRLLGDLLYMNNPIINLETIESPQEHPVNIQVSTAAAYAVLKIQERQENLY